MSLVLLCRKVCSEMKFKKQVLTKIRIKVQNRKLFLDIMPKKWQYFPVPTSRESGLEIYQKNPFSFLFVKLISNFQVIGLFKATALRWTKKI